MPQLAIFLCSQVAFHLFYQFLIGSSLDIQIEHNFLSTLVILLPLLQKSNFFLSAYSFWLAKEHPLLPFGSLSGWCTSAAQRILLSDPLQVKGISDGYLLWPHCCAQHCRCACMPGSWCWAAALQCSIACQSALPASAIISGNTSLILTLWMDLLLLHLYRLWYSSVRCHTHSTAELSCFTQALVGHWDSSRGCSNWFTAFSLALLKCCFSSWAVPLPSSTLIRIQESELHCWPDKFKEQIGALRQKIDSAPLN